MPLATLPAVAAAFSLLAAGTGKPFWRAASPFTEGDGLAFLAGFTSLGDFDFLTSETTLVFRVLSATRAGFTATVCSPP
jgi:hypothetical protein